MKPTFLIVISALGTLFAACGENKAPATTLPETEETQEAPKAVMGEATGPANSKLEVYKAPETDAFSDATLNLAKRGDVVDGRSSFEFDVANYELATQTSDAQTRGCANSAKGQHIHFILNNAPYKAHYSSSFDEAVQEGNNVLLAFLSRSYHESVKAPNAAVITSFQIGDSLDGPQIDLAKEEVLFYSRPKGTYKSSTGNKILLDFYLKNCTLNQQDRHVRATIDGETWVLNEWAAYFIEGLDVGVHTIRLELIDATGDLIPGAFNDSGNREFTITAD